MFQTFLSRLGWFFLLLVLQVLDYNHIHIMGYATPMPYIYFLLILPATTPRWLYLMSAFIMGLLIDSFTNTPGMATSVLCFCGLLIPALLNTFRPKDTEDETLLPSIRSMEWGGFLRFSFVLTLIHCSLFFLIETFTLIRWQTLLINIGGSTALTMLMIIGFELIRTKKRK